MMYLRTLEICILKYTNFFLQNFFSSCISMASSCKKDQSKIRSFDGYVNGYVTLFINMKKLITNT